MTNLRVERAAARAAAFLQAEQLTDGGFASFSSPAKTPFRPAITYQTVFAPALILTALSRLDDATIQSVRAKLATWLVGQKSPQWSFNYWAQNAPERERLPYPDDLDDTFCALVALHRHDPSLITQTGLGKAVQLLLATESQVGGPYRTWLVRDTAAEVWRDIDLAVNCNIAYFLKHVAEPLPNVTAFMEQSIAAQTFESPYYPSAYPLLYYLARAYSGPLHGQLHKTIIKRRRADWWGTPLQTALALSALAELGTKPDKAAVARLLEAQAADGSWPAEAFCLDPAMQGRAHYNGAAALTTALVLQALGHYRPVNPPATARAAKNSDPLARRLQREILVAARGNCHKLDATLRRHGLAMLNYICQHDKSQEIILLPHFFNRSLHRPLGPAATPILMSLGLANLYGWTAYTIYDDFLDGEGKPHLLPVASAALRCSLQQFRLAVPQHRAFQKYVEHTFDRIDAANAWETTHCRFAVTDKTITINRLPYYRGEMRLAERSLGHTLTPLGVLAASGIQPDHAEAHAIQQAFCHYIIARQLSDDMHDWEQDFQTGQATYIVTALLRSLRIPAGTHNFAQLLPKMRRQFWHHTVMQICGVMAKHTAQARRLASASSLLGQPHNIVTKLLEPIEATIATTRTEQAKAKEFLASFRG